MNTGRTDLNDIDGVTSEVTHSVTREQREAVEYIVAIAQAEADAYISPEPDNILTLEFPQNEHGELLTMGIQETGHVTAIIFDMTVQPPARTAEFARVEESKVAAVFNVYNHVPDAEIPE